MSFNPWFTMEPQRNAKLNTEATKDSEEIEMILCSLIEGSDGHSLCQAVAKIS